MRPQYVDISAWQPSQIDWEAYKDWAERADGVSRVAMRSSYGVGYTDLHFAEYRKAALAAGIDMIIYYHYAYPQFNSPIREAQWQREVIGDIRPADLLMLDYEEDTPHATVTWAHDWLRWQKFHYGMKRPLLYANYSYVLSHLQGDPGIAKYPLCLADWQFNPNENPPAPAPWTLYHWLQYTDRAHVPGIPGTVDADVYIK